jgi:hypothetical protein
MAPIRKVRSLLDLKEGVSQYQSAESGVGYLLVIDSNSVATQHPDLDTTALKDHKQISKLNKHRKATVQQVGRVIKRLQHANLKLVQNKTTKVVRGREIVDKWFIRVSMTEPALMVAAEHIGLLKKLRPAFIPDENGVLYRKCVSSQPTQIEGGYLPYTKARACGFSNQEEDIGAGTNLPIDIGIPRKNKPGFVYDSRPNRRGIFEAPEPFGHVQSSAFTQAETLEIIRCV